MNLRKVIKLSFGEISRKKRQFFFSLILLMFGIILTGAAMYLYSATEYAAKVCDDSLSYGNAGTYYMTEVGTQFLEGNVQDFLNDMTGVEGVCNFCSFDVSETKWIGDTKEFISLQEGLPYIDYEFNNGICYSMNADAAKLLGIELKDGVKMEDSPFETVTYLYLGEELSSIPIGTEFTMGSDTFKYVVKGYIRKGKTGIHHQINLVDMDLDTYYYNLDRMVIFTGALYNSRLLNPNVESTYFFNIEDSVDKEQVLESVDEVLKKYDLNYYVDNLEYSFEKRAKADKNIADMLIQLAVVVIISVVFIQICMQSSDIISNSRKYGIMYANGFTKADIRKIICVQNLIKLILAYVLALLLGYLMIRMVNIDYASIATYNVMFVLRKYVVLKLALISTAIMVVGTVVPLLVLESMPPVKLMKAKI